MDFMNIQSVVLLSILQSSIAIEQSLEIDGLNGRPPRIHQQPSTNIYIVDGLRLTLPCAASGEPQPDYNWLFNGREIDVALRNDVVFLNSGTGDLTFLDPRVTDEGYYQCYAVNRFGVSVSVKAHVKKARLDPFPDNPPETHVVMEGDSLVLRCSYLPVSVPMPKIYWSLIDEYGDELVDLNHRVTTTIEGWLLFTNVEKSDEKFGRRYACNALNGVSRVQARGCYHYIQVRDAVPPPWHPPTLMYKSPRDNFAVVGERNFQLKCVFSGNPTPEVIWSFPSTVDDFTIHFGTTLEVHNVDRETAGNYSCRAQQVEQSQITADEHFFVRVEESPYWITELEDRSAAVGGSAVFTCDAGGIDEPEIYWYINGLRIEEFPPSTQIRRLTKQTLAFFDLRLEDTMNVQCNATNRHGYIFGEATLIVDPTTEVTSP